MKVQADASKSCLASIQSVLKKRKKKMALARRNVTGAGIVLEYNKETTSNRSPAKI